MFSVYSSDKYKNFLPRKFFKIFQNGGAIISDIYGCLLYTSDAADEGLGVIAV